MALWKRPDRPDTDGYDELPALEELIRREREDLRQSRLAAQVQDTEDRIAEIHAKAKMDKAMAMQQVNAQYNQYTNALSGVGSILGGLGAQQAAMQKPAGNPIRSPGAAGSQERLNDLAMSIGVTPDQDGFVTLTAVLEKIAKAAGLVKPMAKDTDMISAIEEARDAD